MVIEIGGRPESGLTKDQWEKWLAHVKNDFGGGGAPPGLGGGGAPPGLGGGGAPPGLGGGDWGFGAGGTIGIGILPPGDSNFGAYDFPTWGGWGGGAGAPISFDDEAFGPGGIFGIAPPPHKDKKPAPTRLDVGGWRRPGAPGALQPGSKFEGGSNAPPAPMPIRPLTKNSKSDFRFEQKLHKREIGHPDFPGGTKTISLESTDERGQTFLTFHADARLVAANRGPSPAFGTPVCDVTANGDLALMRHAPLQSALRVVKSPQRTNKPGQTTDQAPAEIPNCLSLNIGTTGLGETIGLLATDNSYGRNRHARLTRADGGPWAVGPIGCKHRLGTDGDNDPILPMHIPCEGLFSFDDKNATLDGPFAFNPILLGEYAARSGYTYRVDSCWDPGWVYVNGAATYRGAWTFRVQVPMGVTTPSEPKPPPPPPPPPPPTTGGPGEPPTTGGGGGGGPSTPGGGGQGTGTGPPPPPPPPPPTTPSSPARITPGDTRRLAPRDHAAMTAALGLSALVFRPRLMSEGARDLTYGLDATMAELSAFEANAPAVLRMEVYGKQGGTAGGAIFGGNLGPDFMRTQERGKSVARGGTASGAAWLFPPELGLEDVDDGATSDVTRSVSSSYFGFGPGVRLGFGLPDVPSGTMKTGFDLGVTSSEWLLRSMSSLAVATNVLGQTATKTAPKVAFAFEGVLSPAMITASVDNYNPTGLSTAAVLHLTSDADWDITGIAGGSGDRILFVHNDGAFTLTLKNNTTSTTTNRFSFPSGDVELGPRAVALLQYNGTTQRWRLVGGSGASAPTAPVWTYTAQNSNYGATIGDFVDMDSTAAVRTVTLPTAVGVAGEAVVVRKSDASGNKVIVATTGGQSINAGSTFDLLTQYDVYTFVSDGANWMVM